MAISSPETWGVPSAPSAGASATVDGERLTLAVVDPDPRLRTRLALQLGEDGDVVTYPEVAALAEYQAAARPLVVVFGPGLADGSGLADIERFTRAHEHTNVPGMGLGLPMAQTLLGAIGAVLSLDDPVDGIGTRMVIRL